MAVCAAALAAPPPVPPASTAQGADPAAVAGASGDAPDDDFIEFLGADDVGDAAWWDFLKKRAPQPADASTTSRDGRP